jgi:hypothetical protein
MIHYLLIAYLKFLHGFKLGMTELTNRIRDTLMQNQSLLEVLSLDRKFLRSHQTGIHLSKRNFSANYCSEIFTGQQ